MSDGARPKPPFSWAGTDPTFLGLVLVLGVVLAYAAGITRGSFHFDDFHSIVENRSVWTLSNAGRFFTDVSTWSEVPGNVMYRPVGVLSAAVDHAIWGGRASGWLLTNVLLHAGVVLLVWRLALRLGLSPFASLLGALVMALHPAHSEVANYVSARSESLAALLMLCALHLHLTARSRTGGARAGFALAAMALYGISLLAKETPALFWAAVAWMELVLPRDEPVARRAGRAVAWTVAYAAVFAGVLLLRHAMLPHATADVALIKTAADANHQAGGSISVFDNVVKVQSRVVVLYIQTLLRPVLLDVDHDVSRAPVWTLSVVVALALHASVLACAFAELRRGRRLFALCVGWFWLFLAPSIAYPLNVIMNEHRLYLPGIAVALLAGAALARVAELLVPRLGAARAAAVVAAPFVLFLALDFHRSLDWRNDETLWRVAVGRNGTARAHMHLGAAIVTRGQAAREDPGLRKLLLEEGRAHYRIAEAKQPEWYDLQLNLGSVHLQIAEMTQDPADFEAALGAYRHAGRIVGEDNPRPRYFQSIALSGLRRDGEALAIIRELRAGDTSKTPIYAYAEARILRRAGDRAGARDAMLRVIDIEEPEGKVEGLLTLGWWCYEDRDKDGAEHFIGRAIDLVKAGRSKDPLPYLYAARLVSFEGGPTAGDQIRQFLGNAERLGWGAPTDELAWAVQHAATPGARRGTVSMPTYGDPR